MNSIRRLVKVPHRAVNARALERRMSRRDGSGAAVDRHGTDHRKGRESRKAEGKRRGQRGRSLRGRSLKKGGRMVGEVRMVEGV